MSKDRDTRCFVCADLKSNRNTACISVKYLGREGREMAGGGMQKQRDFFKEFCCGCGHPRHSQNIQNQMYIKQET